MQTESFSLTTAKQLFEDAPRVDSIDKNTGKSYKVSDHEPARAYLKKYFFPMDDSSHFFWDAEDKKFVHFQQDTIKKTYFARLPKVLSTWYFTDYDSLFKAVNNIHKPRLYDNKINLSSSIKHKIKPYVEYSVDIKNKVAFFVSYIKEVLCAGNEKSLIYVLKWISWMCQGKKNDSLLYFKGIEGIGKSTLSEFLCDHVIGHELTVKSNAEPLRTANNKILCGKLFVVFEELPTFSKGEWEAVSSKLKDLVTGKTTMYSDKYEKAFESQNINNYFINTNVDAIKCSQGRRYFIAECSTHRKEDHAYFRKIREQCFNDEIGEAFFNYVLSLDTKLYNAQVDMPETQSKLDAIADRLDMAFQFLKDKYVLKRLDLKCTVGELYEQYVAYCGFNHSPLSKIKFNAKLKEVNIDKYKSNDKHLFSETHARLEKIAIANKWIHELDEYAPIGKPEPVKLETDFLAPEVDANGQETVVIVKPARNKGTKKVALQEVKTEKNNDPVTELTDMEKQNNEFAFSFL
jgi:hypothetical protein